MLRWSVLLPILLSLPLLACIPRQTLIQRVSVPPLTAYVWDIDFPTKGDFVCTVSVASNDITVSFRQLDGPHQETYPRLTGMNTLRFSVPERGRYRLELDNTYSLLTPKEVGVRCEWSPRLF